MDTSFLRGTSHKNPNLNKIFEHCKNGLVKICISEITAEEWRTQRAEEIITEIDQARKAIKSTNEVWKKNIVAEIILNPIDGISLPTEMEIKEKSKERIAKYIEENKIRVIKPTAEHYETVLKKNILNALHRLILCNPEKTAVKIFLMLGYP